MIKIARYRLSAALFGLAERCYRFADKVDPPQTLSVKMMKPSEWPEREWRK